MTIWVLSLAMKNTIYHAPLTFGLYALAGVLFALYTSRVCPFLATLSTREIATQVGAVFILAWLIRHTLLRQHIWARKQQSIQLDTALLFAMSLPLALYYNLQYQFTLDSNLKVLFGMTLFGFFTGALLQLSSKLRTLRQMPQSQNLALSSDERRSLVKQLIGLIVLLISTLTVMLSMVAIKDIHWLENNPARLLDGSGKISIVKEFAFLSLVLGGYITAILVLWSRMMKEILDHQERSLQAVTQGNLQVRLPVYSNDELGNVAMLTNQMLDSLEATQNEVKTTRDVAIVSLSALAESRDNETGAHILRTQEYVKALAEYLAAFPQYSTLLTPAYIELLYKSAPLHDVGKVGIPDSVLLKPGELTDEEFTVMKEHPRIGAQALAIAERHLGTSSFLAIAKEIALTHHEKWDGTGYPAQLQGEAIPLSGRLMALADVYDALISARVYKPAFSHDKAKAIIVEGSGHHFDPAVVEAFLAVEEKFVAIAAHFKDAA
ncbi:metal-dependent phosphohydrolase [Vibrio cholerae]|nr:metal-dependent phosphohydrolase [Vibrio cholerae]